MNGRTLDGKYRIIRRVGAGGMGAVYVAERTDGGGAVAVKVISSREHAANPVVVERFYREAQAAGRIDSPHIPRVFDAGADPESGAPYIAMELLQGQDLHRFTKRVGPLDPELTLRISAQACRGLADAHQASVIHRDIKSANLFLARMSDGSVTVKVLDFGIAKLKNHTPMLDDEHNTGLTRTGMLLGSPLFMSPEQSRGMKQIDGRSDLWSLGTVIFRMLAGRAPYEHIRAVGELLFAICSAPPPLVQNLAPWVPPELAGLLERALRLDPDERFQSAAEMHAAIRAVLGDDGDETITQEMLVGITPEQRARVAPRFDGAEPMAAPATLPGVPSRADSGAESSLGVHGTGAGPITTGGRGPAATLSGPGLQRIPGIPAATITGSGRGGGAIPGSGHGLASARNNPGATPGPGEPASFAPGSEPFPRQAFPSNRSTEATDEQGISNSASLLDIAAFRPSRTPVFVVGGFVAVLIAAALVQFDGSDPVEPASPTTPAVAPTPGVEPAATVARTAAAKPSAAASAGASGSGGPGGPLFRGNVRSGPQAGDSAATRTLSTPGMARTATPGDDPRAPPAASTGKASAPLDPNGFGDRK